jgi:nucleotide-binding universal stress UspA family protein
MLTDEERTQRLKAALAGEVGLKSILVASDLTEDSRKPLLRAISIARHFKAKLYVAHVVSGLGFTIAGAEATDLAAAAARREAAEAEQKLAASGALDGVAHEILVRQGDVWNELGAIVLEKHIELIVIGTHARQGIERLMLGSLAEQIFRESDKPVVTVGPHAPLESPLESADGMRLMLFATDFSRPSLHALPYAISFANHFRAKLVLLHVAPVMPISESFSWSTAPGNIEGMRQEGRQKAWKELRRILSESAPLAVEPELLVEFGKHGEQILNAARSFKADLIILGLDHSKHGRIASHLRMTTAYHVVSQAHCSVLTVRS